MVAWELEQISYFTAYIVGLVSRIKTRKLLTSFLKNLHLCWNAKQNLPAAQVLHFHTCIIDQNLNKHFYISTNSTNRVEVNFAFTCTGHVMDICLAPASETEMMKCLHRWEFHGHIWKHGKQNISMRLRTTWQAPSYLIWRRLSSLFNLTCRGLRNRPHTSYFL